MRMIPYMPWVVNVGLYRALSHLATIKHKTKKLWIKSLDSSVLMLYYCNKLVRFTGVPLSD